MATRSSRKRAGLERAVSMMPRMRCSRSETTGFRPDVIAGAWRSGFVLRSSQAMIRPRRFAARCPGRRHGAASFARRSYDLAFAREAAVVVVGGAGPLRRDHARADRVLGGAGGPEHLALPRLDDALEDLAALARLGVGDTNTGHLVAHLGVEVGVVGGEAQGTLRDEAEPSPLEVRPQLEDLRHHLERAQVPLVRDDTAVLELDLTSPHPELAQDHV